jgi:hypothetical protein
MWIAAIDTIEDYYVILATDEHAERRKIAGIKADLIKTPN